MSRHEKKLPLVNRELSWLSFNGRVLQEAENPNVPLAERMKFLAIFSSNLDEFFRVRVASVRRLLRYQKKNKLKEAEHVAKVLATIQQTVMQQQEQFLHIYENRIIPELADNRIFIINENQLTHSQKVAVNGYIKSDVLSYMFPIMLENLRDFPFLRDKSIYLAVKLSKLDGSLRPKYALLEVPANILGRFYVLPALDDNTYIMLLDDVIRLGLPEIFSFFDYDHFEAYTIKVTRDAELDIDNDMSESLVAKLSKSLKERPKGVPVRFIYDEDMPQDMLDFIVKKSGYSKEGIIPGGRYHNFKDFFEFPSVGPESFRNPSKKPIPIPQFEKTRALFDEIKKGDVMLHHPYQPFDYVIRLLREAAIDPNVYAIKITLYRVAQHSNIVNALINAVKNGKDVTVVMELQARFDEESNLYWSGKLQEAGAEVIFGVPNYKIHAKCCVIFRKENNKTVHYAHFSTGNYNGRTARLYGDSSLLTCDPRLTKDAVKIFAFIKNFPRIQYKFSHLLVAPFYMKKQFLALIEAEIRHAKKGKEAWIKAKMNSLVDEEMIAKLYAASAAGVKIQLVIRGICCLVPGMKGQSDNIEIISIVDKFLEHSRVFIFCADGEEKMYLSSADWMSRNLDRRIEVAFPIYHPEAKQQVKDMFEIQWSDNVKARRIDAEQKNKMKKPEVPLVRSQEETYHYLLLRSSE
ncbi:MAG: polyphosphate kinase 1 [Bacteroidetes bacterium]|nr:MAG: polyphosphate kinase 1 [Bacteroidota bacterium]